MLTLRFAIFLAPLIDIWEQRKTTGSTYTTAPASLYARSTQDGRKEEHF